MILLLSACVPERVTTPYAPTKRPPTPTAIVTPAATRPSYLPGQLVDYIAQPGDTLPALAVRFNSKISEIRTANAVIPADVTTLPPGLPLKMPIYYQPFWSSSYLILPDSLYVNGPAQRGFNTNAFLQSQLGWFKDYGFYTDRTRNAGELIDQIATDYSISPRLLLALVEYQTGGITQAGTMPEDDYWLGYVNAMDKGLYRQLVWAADFLNQSYYGWRSGRLTTFEFKDGTLARFDPWLNAVTATLQYYFSRILPREAYDRAVSPQGLAQTYQALFGDPWQNVAPHIPGSLTQPVMRLPFSPGVPWAYTGGPHTGWGSGEPLAAIDFAPPALTGGCLVTPEWATAVAEGLIVRTGTGIVVLDLDGDMDERTGWVVFYLHIAANEMVKKGERVRAGDPIGHPSCEGGKSTGTHVHMARKYNGEWIEAEGVLAFNLDGWVAANGAAPYLGTLTRHGKVVRACTCSDSLSHIWAGP